MAPPTNRVRQERKLTDQLDLRAADRITKLAAGGFARRPSHDWPRFPMVEIALVEYSRLSPGWDVRRPHEEATRIRTLFPLIVGASYFGLTIESYHDGEVEIESRGVSYLLDLTMFVQVLVDLTYWQESMRGVIDMPKPKSVTGMVVEGAAKQAESLALGAKRFAQASLSPSDRDRIDRENARFVSLIRSVVEHGSDIASSSPPYILAVSVIVATVYREMTANEQAALRKRIKSAAVEALPDFIISFVANKLGKEITKRAVMAVAKTIARSVAGEVAYVQFKGAGASLAVVSMLGTIERASLFSRKLSEERPFLFALLRPHNLDLLYFLIAEKIDVYEERITQELTARGPGQP